MKLRGNLSHAGRTLIWQRSLLSTKPQPQSFLSKLRLKIASTVTSSLSPSEKNQFFESLDFIVSTEDRKKIDNHSGDTDNERLVHESVGEAVAAAVAKKAAEGRELAKKQKEEIWREAEKATMNRVMNDLLLKERKVKLERWERELMEDKLIDERSNFNESGIANVAAGENEEPHPILGKIVLDLGYKKIYVVSAEKLAAIPIWEKQRVYSHDRAKIMANDKLKSLELGLPGVIALHESREGQLSILDGQHRVGMMTILEGKRRGTDNEFDFDLSQILVEVFPQPPEANETHAQDIFTEINKAEPVKLVDMPGVAKVGDRRIINEAAAMLQDKFPNMFKPSQRCRSPHLNIDNLRDSIFAARIIQKHNIKSHTALLKWMLTQNEELCKKVEEEASPQAKPAALQKAKKNGFYLGLEMSWLYK